MDVYGKYIDTYLVWFISKADLVAPPCINGYNVGKAINNKYKRFVLVLTLHLAKLVEFYKSMPSGKAIMAYSDNLEQGCSFVSYSYK